jgi:hypothetical protein
MNKQPSKIASEAPSVTLTRDDRRARSAQPAARREAHLPHERDQHPDSQAAPEASNHEIGEQAFRDVSHGLVDTDEALRKSAVDRRSAQPMQPAGKLTPPREATLAGGACQPSGRRAASKP